MSLVPWDQVVAPLEALGGEPGAEGDDGPDAFPVEPQINGKLMLVQGTPKVFADLRVGALVNRTNDRLSDWSGLSAAILQRAGATLREECSFVPSKCQTGEAKVTRGCQLRARFVIHVVGPKYTEPYKGAAENSLHSCYRSALTAAKEQGVRSVAFPCIHTPKKGFPRDLGAHVAIRTIRRFLERYGGDFDHVVLFFDEPEDYNAHKRALVTYCPRSREELLWARSNMPAETGNEWGEVAPPDRKIRVAATLCAKPAGAECVHAGSTAAAKVGPPLPPRPATHPATAEDSAMAQAAARAAVETERFEPVVYGTEAMADNANYAAYLERARCDDLKDMFALNIVYQSGTDRLGRPIIVFSVSNMNVPGLDLERLFLYTIRVCDPLVSDSRGYVLVILDDNVDSAVAPSIGWIQSLYDDVIGRKYKKNIKRMLVLHPTIGTKVLLWAAMPFVSSKFWNKHAYVETLDELYSRLPGAELLLPKATYAIDKQLMAERDDSWFL